MQPTNLEGGARGAARLRGQCVSATSAGGLDHHVQVQAFSGPTTDDVPVRALQPNKFKFSSLVQLASGSNEPGDGGGRSKISGLVRQCNFRWWPRRFALQVKNDTEQLGNIVP